MRPVTCAPFGITVFPSTVIGVVRLAAKVSPTLFLSVASVWPTVALISVPFGTVTIAIGTGALLTAVAFAAAGFAVAAFAATGFTAAGFAAAAFVATGFAAAGFAGAAFLAVVTGSS